MTFEQPLMSTCKHEFSIYVLIHVGCWKTLLHLLITHPHEAGGALIAIYPRNDKFVPWKRPNLTKWWVTFCFLISLCVRGTDGLMKSPSAAEFCWVFTTKAGTERGPGSPPFTGCALVTLGCSVWISRRSSWFITHSPSEPFPFSQPVTHVQTNQGRRHHLSHFTQLDHRYTRLKCTTAFTLQYT